eukprot:TRINITY_DN5240_c0_g1_i2.p1 TRINITY_DN5240_c0_g1~~TRINITY_DN5240_c0_g1_i2.p1  ORF type:complete len:819 (-),score=201.85 TRINITY_DN5240_c0_g1_i2:288-2384(-)
MSDTPPPPLRLSRLRAHILIVGITGAGKTSLVNFMHGHQILPTTSVGVGTTEMSMLYISYRGMVLEIADFPGSDDRHRSRNFDTVILPQIGRYIEQHKDSIAAIWFVTKGVRQMGTESNAKTLEGLRRECGDEMMDRLTFIITHACGESRASPGVTAEAANLAVDDFAIGSDDSPGPLRGLDTQLKVCRVDTGGESLPDGTDWWKELCEKTAASAPQQLRGSLKSFLDNRAEWNVVVPVGVETKADAKANRGRYAQFVGDGVFAPTEQASEVIPARSGRNKHGVRAMIFGWNNVLDVARLMEDRGADGHRVPEANFEIFESQIDETVPLVQWFAIGNPNTVEQSSLESYMDYVGYIAEYASEFKILVPVVCVNDEESVEFAITAMRRFVHLWPCAHKVLLAHVPVEIPTEGRCQATAHVRECVRKAGLEGVEVVAVCLQDPPSVIKGFVEGYETAAGLRDARSVTLLQAFGCSSVAELRDLVRKRKRGVKGLPWNDAAMWKVMRGELCCEGVDFTSDAKPFPAAFENALGGPLQHLHLPRCTLHTMNFDQPVWRGLKRIRVPEIGLQSISMGALPALESLILWGNPLRRLPSIGHLRTLRVLSAANCELQEVPEGICQLAYLEKVDLEENNIADLPGTLAALSRLEELQLAGNNRLRHVPDFFLAFRHLSFLTLPALDVVPPSLVTLEADGERVVLRD